MNSPHPPVVNSFQMSLLDLLVQVISEGYKEFIHNERFLFHQRLYF